MDVLDDYEIAEEVIDDEERRLEEWHALRSGKLTCSRFGDLMGKGVTPAKVIPVAGYSYLKEKIAERLGSYKFSASASSLSWGHNNEPHAVLAYQETTGHEVDYDSHRFVTHSDFVGGSPDGLVGADRTLEIKCPYNPATHVETLLSLEVPGQYRWQCVGHCLVTGRPTCDFVSFDPRMDGPNRIVVIEFEPTAGVLASLKSRLAEAVEWIQSNLTTIQEASL